jgi:hypothetical protein
MTARKARLQPTAALLSLVEDSRAKIAARRERS